MGARALNNPVIKNAVLLFKDSHHYTVSTKAEANNYQKIKQQIISCSLGIVIKNKNPCRII
jgi:hypothetical protein